MTQDGFVNHQMASGGWAVPRAYNLEETWEYDDSNIGDQLIYRLTIETGGDFPGNKYPRVFNAIGRNAFIRYFLGNPIAEGTDENYRLAVMEMQRRLNNGWPND